MQLTQVAESVFTIDGFMSRAECLAHLVRSEEIGYELAKVNTARGAQVKPDVRNNSRAFDRNEALARTLWARLAPFVPAQWGRSRAVGLNELFRFYRYQRGHQFKGHYDEPYIRNAEEMSYFTFMVYLNDNFQGGDTSFRQLRIQPRQGRALVFAHDLFHAGSEVTQGVKYVLRTDVMYRLDS